MNSQRCISKKWASEYPDINIPKTAQFSEHDILGWAYVVLQRYGIKTPENCQDFPDFIYVDSIVGESSKDQRRNHSTCQRFRVYLILVEMSVIDTNVLYLGKNDTNHSVSQSGYRRRELQSIRL